jgi:hypothetical protein
MALSDQMLISAKAPADIEEFALFMPRRAFRQLAPGAELSWANALSGDRRRRRRRAKPARAGPYHPAL